VDQKAAKGCPYAAIAQNPDIVAEAQNTNWDEIVIEEFWTEPAGMGSELDGPC
jgi:hypothetical protein